MPPSPLGEGRGEGSLASFFHGGSQRTMFANGVEGSRAFAGSAQKHAWSQDQWPEGLRRITSSQSRRVIARGPWCGRIDIGGGTGAGSAGFGGGTS